MHIDIPNLLKNPNWIILTNQNPDGKKLSSFQNAVLFQDLIRKLQHEGIKFEIIYGMYKGIKEEAVFLQGFAPVSRKLAAEYAKMYGQECVLTADGLVYQDGSSNPAIAMVLPHSEPEDNFSLLQSTYFNIEIDTTTRVAA